ncbi:MAG: hypothetical protein ACPHID_06240 [Thermoplasmatota archaeon]
MRTIAAAVLVLLLAGCLGAESSSQVSWNDGSGDFTIDLDCGAVLDLSVRSDVADGELFFTVLDGANQTVMVYDLQDHDLVQIDERLEGEPGNWKVGGTYDSMEGPGSVRISC